LSGHFDKTAQAWCLSGFDKLNHRTGVMVIKHCGFDKRFALLLFYIGERTPQTLPVASLLRSFETTAVRLRRGDSGKLRNRIGREAAEEKDYGCGV
jgi:hypothetical protein